MADALWNDIIYTDVLQSDGFVIDYAVCTTYSLDMPSLLSVPFMLGTMTDLTETAMRSPHLILREFDIRSKDSKLSVIDKVYVNGGLLFKKAVCCYSRQRIGYKIIE